MTDSASRLARSGALSAPFAAPRARREPHECSEHGHMRTDHYAWLRDPDYPDVRDAEILAHLEAENGYFEAVMAPHAELVETLFTEIRGRQPEADESVPVRRDAYYYQWRFEAGAQYRLWQRWPVSAGESPPAAARQQVLDERQRAEGLEYYRMGGMAISPDGRYCAFTEDTDGSERYTLRILDLQHGVMLADEIAPTIGAPVWSAAADMLFYPVLSDNWRPNEIRLHRLGTDPRSDTSVLREADEGYFLSVDLSQSREWVILTAGMHTTTEVSVIPAATPTAPPRQVSVRREGHEYDLDHGAGRFWIRTNDRHRNFRLVSAAVDRPEPEHWVEEIAGSDARYLRGVSAFANCIVIEERRDGLDQICLRDPVDGSEHLVAFPEVAYSAELGSNPQPQAGPLRLVYESMVTPTTVYDYDLDRRQLDRRRVQPIPSGYDATDYETRRLQITVRDGTAVPVSVVARRGVLDAGPAPLYLYGYGAYGIAITPGFSPSRLSLLDRGFVFAIAHIRGGDDLGYQWYLDGKLDQRTRTFNDFVDVARGLVALGHTRAGLITAAGGSAGGELMGAVVNQAPTLFGAVAAHVPFVDVLNTMLDETLPLTPMEWPEWGNPIVDPQAWETIAAYSPYDNVAPQAYPPMLVTAGLNDPRVTYWEPAKWVARLRHEKTDDNVVLLKTNMGAGHGGKSGRFESLRDLAEEYAFMLLALDIAADGAAAPGDAGSS